MKLQKRGMIMEYNCRKYEYPSGTHVTVYKKTITKQERTKNTDNTDDYNTNQAKKKENFTKAHKDENRTREAEEHCKSVSLSATKNKIYNIARSNIWEWFITLTFDRTRTDSADYDIVTRRITKFLSNIRQFKCPDMKYLIVPELHKDKTHYHFHGLLSSVDGLRFCFSGRFDKKNGMPVFNILNWPLGFTTATQVKDTERASGYITKYITKDLDLKLKNKHRYLCSRNVERTEPEYLIVDEEELLEVYGQNITYAKSVTVPAAHQSINYYEFKD